MKKSPKEISLENTLKRNISGIALRAAEIIFDDPEIHAMQEFANTVSIKRLGYNDHGPVHMKKSALNAIKMCNLLKAAGVEMTLQRELCASYEDSLTAVTIASLLHDLGMSIAREDHELYSITLAMPIVERILLELYPEDLETRVIIKSTVLEGIAGHMATRKIHSLEAGLVLIGDGCDMEKGRARIPTLLNTTPKVGDIHRYSASSIEKVHIRKGEVKPICIQVVMSESVGFFQIEEVLFPKIKISPVMPYIELLAGVEGEEPLKYL
ncbi:MAG: phosphohydrolase [Candidatus Cloacimonetes bacterium]|nr:phosphohydrolase [Candidatus Cloacimonadota bacterium]